MANTALRTAVTRFGLWLALVVTYALVARLIAWLVGADVFDVAACMALALGADLVVSRHRG